MLFRSLEEVDEGLKAIQIGVLLVESRRSRFPQAKGDASDGSVEFPHITVSSGGEEESDASRFLPSHPISANELLLCSCASLLELMFESALLPAGEY